MAESPDDLDLHYRIYLLAYDLGKDQLYDRTRTAFLCRAAALTQLAILGLIVDDDGRARLANGGSTDDPVLAAALKQVSEHNRTWQDWLRRSYQETLAATESNLVSMSVITISRTKAFGLFKRTKVTVADRNGVATAQQAVREILRDSTPADQVDLAHAAAVALAAIGRMPTVISRADAKEHSDRIDALTSRIGTLAPGLEKAYRGLHTTMVAAQGGIGGS